MMNKILKFLEKITNYFKQSQATSGIVFISGATTISGNFNGLSIGSMKPDSIVLTVPGSMYEMNSTYLQTDDDVAPFVVEGQYIPIEFTSITTTGSGYVIAYKK